MSLIYELCEDLTDEQCAAFIVWNNLNRADRNVIVNVLSAFQTPGYVLPRNNVLIVFFNAVGLARYEKRAERFVTWMGFIYCESCAPGGGAGYLVGSSVWLGRFYELQLLGRLPFSVSMTPLANFPDKTVIVPNTVG